MTVDSAGRAVGDVAGATETDRVVLLMVDDLKSLFDLDFIKRQQQRLVACGSQWPGGLRPARCVCGRRGELRPFVTG